MSPVKKVMLLGCGSYNPPTLMHLRMFEIAKDTLTRQGYYVVGGVMSPVHDGYGKKELANATHRCAMVRQALYGSTWIRLSDWESRQEEWQPTRQVLQYHQNTLNSLLNANNETSSPQKRQRRDDMQWLPDETLLGTEGTVQIKLLCGGDLLESFGTPGLWKDEHLEAMVGQHGLVVITREGTNPYKFIYESDMLTKFQNNIIIVTEWIANEVSSTKIRRALRRGESVKYLIPDTVLSYIEKNSLYSSEDNKYDNKSSSISLYPTPSPSDIQMGSSPTTLYMNELNSRSTSSSGSSAGGFLALPGSCRALRPPSLLIQEDSSSTIKKSVLLTATFPGQAVQVLEVRPQAEGASSEVEKQLDSCAPEETKVQIQITKDGIKVISDKETTV